MSTKKLGWLVGARDGKKLGSSWDPVNSIPTLYQPGPFQSFAFLGLSLALMSHDQFQASYWSFLPSSPSPPLPAPHQKNNLGPKKNGSKPLDFLKTNFRVMVILSALVKRFSISRMFLFFKLLVLLIKLAFFHTVILFMIPF